MLENFFQTLFDRSSAMKALRISAKKATILGIAEGLGCDMTQAEHEVNVVSDQSTKAIAEVAEKPKALPGIPLPKPQSLGVKGAKLPDEPDRPGVPPNRIRSKRRTKETAPNNDIVTEELPGSNGDKGDAK